MWIIKYKKFFIGISLALMIVSLGILVLIPARLSIDFTGGTVMEYLFEERPEITEVQSVLREQGIDARAQVFGTEGILIRIPTEQSELIDIVETTVLQFDGNGVLVRSDTIGPALGRELGQKALIAFGVIALLMILFIAFVFRHVSRPVSSWHYGAVAVFALVHDVLIPTAIFILFGLEISSLFIVGILTILGVSVNDTIVVFDRIREQLKHRGDQEISKEDFSVLVGESIQSTLARSLMTSLTLLVTLIALYIFGPESTQSLALVMGLGVLFGTYSSVFFASPLVVYLQKKSTELQ
jgi:preprotein translocase SecF subunit